MTVLQFVKTIGLTFLIASGGQQVFSQRASTQPQFAPPVSCPVTVRPAHAFTPPSPYEVDTNAFWWGTEKLWTFLYEPGSWGWQPRKPGQYSLTAKLFWMSTSHDPKTEPHPQLRVTGRRLDGNAPPLFVTTAHNTFAEPAAAMGDGVYVPTPGCWEITGQYKGEKLSFVVWVNPAQ